MLAIYDSLYILLMDSNGHIIYPLDIFIKILKMEAIYTLDILLTFILYYPTLLNNFVR
jgi:hypothetical protein